MGAGDHSQPQDLSINSKNKDQQRLEASRQVGRGSPNSLVILPLQLIVIVGAKGGMSSCLFWCDIEVRMQSIIM